MNSSRRILISLLCAVSAIGVVACANADDAPKLKELQRAQAGALDVVMLSAGDALKQGKDSFVVEFRSRPDQRLVNVGAIRINATMTMAGMAPMIGNITANRIETGRYEVASDLEMAGSWRIGLEWDGPAGNGSATLQGRVQ